MADRREDSAIGQAASTAHTAYGALKTGKAIAAAAKGASAAGPYGAVAGALWGSRHHIGKIIAVIAFLLLLPILFNHVGAWISRAAQRLRSNRAFRSAFSSD